MLRTPAPLIGALEIISNQEKYEMPKHDVSFSIPERALGKADVKFLVKSDGSVLGTLAISNGSMVWFPKGTTYGLKIGWKKFNELMQGNATRLEKR